MRLRSVPMMNSGIFSVQAPESATSKSLAVSTPGESNDT